jgi:hypothetical protein
MSERIKRQRETQQPTAKRVKKEDACIGNLVNIRKYLGYFDTMHDFLDSSRLEKYLGNKKDAERVIDKIQSTFDLGFSCDIGNDEDSIIRKVFGSKSPNDIPYSDVIQQDLRIITNNTKMTPPYYGEPFDRSTSFNEKSIIVDYDQLPAIVRWIDSLLVDPTTNTSKQYILDYTQIPENAVCDLINSTRIPNKSILKTIASEYDRNTTYKETLCIQTKDYVKDSKTIQDKLQDLTSETKDYYLPVSEEILLKTNGELHEFDSIKIGPVTGENNYMEWTLQDTIKGQIYIENLTSKDASDKRKKNLNLFIHRMVEMMKTAPIQKKPTRGKRVKIYKIMKADYDQLITDIYQLDATVVTNKKTYTRCLTDFKKIGDLLLVKMARLNDAIFVSNDRVTSVMASIGYNVPTIRTSLLQYDKTEDSERIKAQRVLTLYNFREFVTSETSKRLYLLSSIKEYYNALNFYVQLPDDNYLDFQQRIGEKIKNLKQKINDLEILTSDELNETNEDDVIVSDSISNPSETVQMILDSIVARFTKPTIQMYELMMIEHQLAEIRAIYKTYQLNPESNQLKTIKKLHLQLKEVNRAKQATRRDLIHLTPLTRQLIPFMDEIINEAPVSRSRTRGTIQGFYNISYTRALAFVPLLEYLSVVLNVFQYLTSVRTNIQGVLLSLNSFMSQLDTHSYETLEQGLRMIEAIFKENFIPLPGTVFNEKIPMDRISSSMGVFKRTLQDILEFNPLSNVPFNISNEIPLMNYPTKNLTTIMNKLNISIPDTPHSINFEDYSYKLYVGILENSRESIEELLTNIDEFKQFVNDLKSKLHRTSGGKGSTPSFEPKTPSRSSAKTKTPIPSFIQKQPQTLSSKSRTSAVDMKKLIQQTNQMTVSSYGPSTPSIEEKRYIEKTYTNLPQLERYINTLSSLTIEPLQCTDIFDIFNSFIVYDISHAENEEEADELMTLYVQVMFIKRVYGQNAPILKMVSTPYVKSSRMRTSS